MDPHASTGREAVRMSTIEIDVPVTEAAKPANSDDALRSKLEKRHEGATRRDLVDAQNEISTELDDARTHHDAVKIYELEIEMGVIADHLKEVRKK